MTIRAMVIDEIDELVAALAKYQDRIGREVELIVRPDGSLVLMGAEEGTAPGAEALGFEVISEFEPGLPGTPGAIDSLWRFLCA